jgi:hypothetical protein
MRIRFVTLFALLFLLALPQAAQALTLLPGSEGFNVEALNEEGLPANQAGVHPYEFKVAFNLAQDGQGPYTEGDLRDLHLSLPQGLLQNSTVLGSCSASQFQAPRISPFQTSASGESCPLASQAGVVEVRSSLGETRTFGVFNLTPDPGVSFQLGFSPFGRPIVLTAHLHGSEGEYQFSLDAEGISQYFDLYGLTLTFWGNPWYFGHDDERGNCLNEIDPSQPFGTEARLEDEPPPPPPAPKESENPPPGRYKRGTCSIGNPLTLPPKAYLTLPPVCTPMDFTLSATAWQGSAPVERSLQTPALGGCNLSPFEPSPLVQLNTDRASSPAGLTFSLLVDQLRLLTNYTPTGRLLPNVRAPSPAKTAIVALPEGVTINPSVGAGLGVCAPARYQAESASSPPGAGCPDESKIGDFTIASPLFSKPIDGAIFLAAPFDNPFNSLISVYLIAKSPLRGVLVKVSGVLRPDPLTGRLTATFENLPQIPYTDLRIHFREGQRSPLASPASCGNFPAEAEFIAWRDPHLIRRASSAISITSALSGGPCPSGVPPFTPAARGGTLNSQAGAYSPFYLHLTRTDDQQEITSYSATFPPGLLGKLAGVPYCPDAAIAAAASRSGVEERDRPSCPAASRIGRTYSGYGVGSVLAYAPGSLYLAGPYHGAQVSVVAIDSALVGPFDLGTIVIRSAIRIDTTSAQASIDATGTDPIPHIVDGIPIHLRDVRIYIDRPQFTINPTSCEPQRIASSLNGSGALFGDGADDSLVTATAPFQAFNCSSLGFRPELSIRAKGAVKRARRPSLRVTVRPHPGDANIGSARVSLPPSLFLNQTHIAAICTRPQLAADKCPAGSSYGTATAFTPLLDQPLTGKAYLVSSHNLLPDLVFDLHGQGFKVDLLGAVDSAPDGGLRATFTSLPDAPVSKFVVNMYGGKRGILENSANLCSAPPLGRARLIGHSNRGWAFRPRLQSSCRRHARSRKSHKGRRR